MTREGDIGEKLFPDFPDMKVDFAEIGIGKIGLPPPPPPSTSSIDNSCLTLCPVAGVTVSRAKQRYYIIGSLLIRFLTLIEPQFSKYVNN